MAAHCPAQLGSSRLTRLGLTLKGGYTPQRPPRSCRRLHSTSRPSRGSGNEQQGTVVKLHCDGRGPRARAAGGVRDSNSGDDPKVPHSMPRPPPAPPTLREDTRHVLYFSPIPLIEFTPL